MGNYTDTQHADLKSGMAFRATADLVFSEVIQSTSITHGLNILS